MNTLDAAACEHCGKPLDNTEDCRTRRLDPFQDYDWDDDLDRSTRLLPASATLPQGTDYIYLQDVDSEQYLRLAYTEGQFIIGRRDDSSDLQPDIDLTNFDASEKGVSREHARLLVSHDAVYIQDLNSANGTRLRGRKIPPLALSAVLSGYILEFGMLAMRIIITNHDDRSAKS